MVAINSNKLFNILEKQHSGAEKQNKYETQCLQYVLVWLYENFQNIVRLIHEDIRLAITNKNEGSYRARKGTGFCGILWHMINCPVFE